MQVSIVLVYTCSCTSMYVFLNKYIWMQVSIVLVYTCSYYKYVNISQ